MYITEDILNAPIMEYDTDSAKSAKAYFFAQGKKHFEDFDEAKKLGIDKCIIFFPRSFDECTEIFKKCVKIHDFKSASSISPIYMYDKKLLIALCPLGGPASANLMEELTFVGIKYFLACGSCGCIVDNIDVNSHFFLPVDAIRDEGLSYHYLPASRKVETNKKLNSEIKKSLINHHQDYVEGTTWTIDALYRETPNRVARRIEEGAIGVEMECASLAAVAKYNKVKFSSLLYFTDKVKAENWDWRFYDKVALRTHLLKVAIDALINYK